MLQLRLLTADPHQVELARRYWQFDERSGTFAQLDADLSAELGGGGLMAAGLLAGACLAYDDADPCPVCGEPVWFFATREEYLAYIRGNAIAERWRVCPACVGKGNGEGEKGERPKREKVDRSGPGEVGWPEVEMRALMQEAWSLLREPPRVRLEDLSLEQAVFLDAYWRAGLAEDGAHLRSLADLNKAKIKLAPLAGYSWEMILALKGARLILYHPHSQAAKLRDYSPTKGFQYDSARALYHFPVSAAAPGDPAALFREIEQAFRTRRWPQHWRAQALPLWRKVAAWESEEYLHDFLSIYGLNFSPGEKTRTLFAMLVERYATAQLWGMVRCAGRMALTYFTRGGVTRQQAAATIPGLVQRLADRAETAHWKVERLPRTRRCAQSVVSQVLFDAALKVGEAGWTEIAKEVTRDG